MFLISPTKIKNFKILSSSGGKLSTIIVHSDFILDRYSDPCSNPVGYKAHRIFVRLNGIKKCRRKSAMEITDITKEKKGTERRARANNPKRGSSEKTIVLTSHLFVNIYGETRDLLYEFTFFKRL